MKYLLVDSFGEKVPPSWPRVQLRRLVRPRAEKQGLERLEMLSLSASAGVIPRNMEAGKQVPSEDSLPAYQVVRIGDIVMNPMWILEGAVARSTLEGVVSPAYRVYEAVEERADGDYLTFVLKCRTYMRQYALLARGVTTFDRSVTRDDFESLPIYLPSIDEQRTMSELARTALIRENSLTNSGGIGLASGLIPQLEALAIELRHVLLERIISGGY